jgi:hypothetical protein
MTLTCADHGTTAVHLHWTSWTPTTATAIGQIDRRGLSGHHTEANFTLSAPIRDANGQGVLFTKLAMHVTGANLDGYVRTASFNETPAPPLPTLTPAPGIATAINQSGMKPPFAASGPLSYAAIEGYWIAAGGPASLASTAAAITGAESSACPGIIQPDQPYATTGWGLWQITSGHSAPPKYGSDYQLLDPWNNAEAAVWKYKEQGLNAWTTYIDGVYEQSAESDVAPATGLTDPGQYVQINDAPYDTPSASAPNPGTTYGPTMPGTIPAPAPPSVSLTAPTSAVQLAGSVKLSATVSDSTPGVSLSTQFYVDGSPIGPPTPGKNPHASWNATPAPANASGTHTITATSTASNSTGTASTTSAPVKVLVKVKANPNPRPTVTVAVSAKTTPQTDHRVVLNSASTTDLYLHDNGRRLSVR